MNKVKLYGEQRHQKTCLIKGSQGICIGKFSISDNDVVALAVIHPINSAWPSFRARRNEYRFHQPQQQGCG